MTEFEASFFKRKKMDVQRLLSFGFLKTQGGFDYSAEILGGQFLMTVFLSDTGDVRTKVLDTESMEEYMLHRVPGACGAFVGMVKEACETVLRDISDACFEPDVFQSDGARQVIAHIQNRYGDAPEFLWRKFPDNAVFRRKDTNKWYAALLTVSGRKLGLDCDEKVEILDLRMKSEEIETVVDHQKYFPGYHMNKKHWITICFDGCVPLDELCQRIHESYQLAVK